MDQHSLERMLAENYGKPLEAASRRLVLEFISQTPTLIGSDVHFIKKLTRAAASAYQKFPGEFNLRLLDHLLTYHDEGIRLAEDSYTLYGQRPNDFKLARHMKGHKATLLSFIVDREGYPSEEQRQDLTVTADNLLEEIIPDLFKAGDYTTLRPLMEIKCKVSFRRYQQLSGDLEMAERVYRAAIGGIVLTTLLNGSDILLHPEKDFKRKMALATQIYKDFRPKKEHSSETLATWARRAYYSTLDYLPLEQGKTRFKADVLVNLGRLAEDMIELDPQNVVTWRNRSRQYYQEFLQFVEQQGLVDSFSRLIKTAQVGISKTSGYLDTHTTESA